MSRDAGGTAPIPCVIVGGGRVEEGAGAAGRKGSGREAFENGERDPDFPVPSTSAATVVVVLVIEIAGSFPEAAEARIGGPLAGE